MRTGRRISRFIEAELIAGTELDGDPLEEGLLDSLAIEQLIQFIEDEFKITFSDDELVQERFSSIDTLARFVDDKRRG